MLSILGLERAVQSCYMAPAGPSLTIQVLEGQTLDEGDTKVIREAQNMLRSVNFPKCFIHLHEL
jgi:hypothetical protein